jgi:heptosyltransferase-2
MDRLVYFIALAVVTVIRRLPLPVCFALGQALGFALWVILPGYRRLARENLRRAFGDEKPSRDIARLARQHFIHLGANALCSFKLAALSKDQILRCTTVEHLDRMNTAIAGGKGVVMVISHIGNWELFAQINFIIPHTKTGTVYQPLRNRHIDELINRDRRRREVATFDRKRGVTKAIALLREGGLVGVLVDQHAGDSGVWTPFFDRLSSTSPLAASLATNTGAAVLPVAIHTDGFAHWRFSVSEVIPAQPTPDALTAAINRVLEAQIRESPADWFWVHNRWKMPHPDFLLARVKRGVYLPKGYDAMRLKPFRILIRSSNWLGDAVMSSLAVRAIKEGRPDARVTVLTRRKLADFWAALPFVDDVIAIPMEAGAIGAGLRIRGRFDVAVLFPNSLRSALEAWIGGIRRRVGYLGHNREWLVNQVVKEPKKRLYPQHQVERYLHIAESMGAPSLPLSFPPAPVPEGPIRIGVCPGAEYGPAKRWYPSRFRDVMQAVSNQIDCTWVLVGVENDIPLGQEILDGFDGEAENLIGRTSLSRLIQELKQMRLLLTNDTGTMHLAAALGVRTVAIFGSTEPALTGPLGDHHVVIRHQVECSPCFQRECPLDFRCMDAVSVDEVTRAVLTIASHPPG